LYLTSFCRVVITIIGLLSNQDISTIIVYTLILATTIIYSTKERIAIFSFILISFLLGFFFVEIEQVIKVVSLAYGITFILFAFIISHLISNYHSKNFSNPSLFGIRINCCKIIIQS
ncbi:MAG: hypothetical protein ACI94Y_003797, partial [Maribacter sp.]